MPKLEALSLAFTEITDEGLYQIKEMFELKGLDLIWVKASDKGMEYLKK